MVSRLFYISKSMNENLILSTARRVVLFVAAFALSIIAMADDGVILKLKNGNEVGFVFSSKPCIATGTELNITTTDSCSIRYDYSEVRSITFGNVSSTDIEDVTASQVCDIVFRLLDGKVIIEGLAADESVNLYNIGGLLLASQKQTANSGVLTLPLEASGVFIIRTSTGVNYKVLKK